MSYTLTQTLIETMVRKAIRDMKDCPKRSTRNLVDMALQFTNSDFQRQFLLTVQKMLKNESSPYYDMIRNIINHVDVDWLVTFSMNIGYHSCTWGARQIGCIEKAQRYHIPWTIALEMDPQVYTEHQSDYDSLIEQGQRLGVYTWQIRMESPPEVLLPLISSHSDSAFAVYVKSGDLTPGYLESIANVRNLMLIIRYEDGAEEVCAAMREMKIGYSIYHVYDANNASEIISGELLDSIQQLLPIFTVLMADASCPNDVQEHVSKQIQDFRERQLFSTIPWEFAKDRALVDRIISGDDRSADFASDGNLKNVSQMQSEASLNLFSKNLTEILSFAFPKES